MAKTKKQVVHGVRQKDMEAAILPLRPTKTETSQPKIMATETLVFTIFGKHDELTDENGNPNKNGFPLLYDTEDVRGNITPAEQLPDAFAKKVSGKKQRFFVKKNSLGKFLNPMGMYSENRHNKVLKHAGREEWEFKEVSPRVFSLYLSFLKSRNKAWLINAEREAF
jgi:hypothetical protein